MKNRKIIKIDEVGRLVIPKEIRNLLQINNGLVKLKVDGESLVVKKYAPIESVKMLSTALLTKVEKLTGCICLMGDSLTVTYVSNLNFKRLENKSLSTLFLGALKRGEVQVLSGEQAKGNALIVQDEKIENGVVCVAPIVDKFAPVGFIALLKTDGQNFEQSHLFALEIAKEMLSCAINSQIEC